jgi:hypothetical protein
MGIFSEYAYQYYKLGMNVMPVHDRDPIVRGYNELWFSNRQTEDELDLLVAEYGHCNGIAMVCGAYGMMLDIDTIEDVPELNALVPRTPMKRFGSKGMGYLFAGSLTPKKQPPTLPLELFGRGYAVLPPSYHPKTGGCYKWVETTFTDISDLPEYPQDNWNKLTEFCFKNGVVKTSIKGSNNYGDGSGGRNITLAARVWALVKDPLSRNKTMGELVEIMMEYDRSKHPTNPWFEDPLERRHKTPIQFATSFVKRNLDKAAKEQGVVVVSAAQYVEPVEEVEVVQMGRVKRESLIPKGGLMEAMHDVVSASNGWENETLSLSAALGLCSALAGHRIVVGRAHPNLFILTTAESGVGKSCPQDAIKNTLLKSVNGKFLIGFDDYASTQSVAKDLPEIRRRIDIIDECKQIFMANTNHKSHLGGIDGELCKIFSASGGYLAKKAAVKDDSKRKDLMCPYLVLNMYSTKAAFYRYFSTMLAEEGFGGRCIFLNDTTDPSSIDRGLIGFDSAVAKDLPQSILDKINYWLTMPISYVNDKGQVEAYNAVGGKPKCHQIVVDQAGQGLLKEYQKQYMERLKGCQQPGDPDYEIKACFMRAIEMHLKLLGCWVVSQSDEKHVLGVSEVEWAHRVVEFSISSLKELMSGAIMNNEVDEMIRRYSAWARGKTEISKARFHEWVRRNARVNSQRDVNDFISTLVSEGFGHYEQEERTASNGKVRIKWVFDAKQ